MGDACVMIIQDKDYPTEGFGLMQNSQLSWPTVAASLMYIACLVLKRIHIIWFFSSAKLVWPRIKVKVIKMNVSIVLQLDIIYIFIITMHVYLHAKLMPSSLNIVQEITIKLQVWDAVETLSEAEGQSHWTENLQYKL